MKESAKRLKEKGLRLNSIDRYICNISTKIYGLIYFVKIILSP